MKRALFLILVAAVPSTVVAATPKTLACSVEIVEAKWGGDLTPKTEFGKRFASFSIDQSIDPDLGWMHQNMCVTKADFVKASFPGTICVLAIGSRIPAAFDGGAGLYVDVSHFVTKNKREPLDGSSFSLATAYPMPLPQLDVSLFSTANGQKYGVGGMTISCVPEER